MARAAVAGGDFLFPPERGLGLKVTVDAAAFTRKGVWCLREPVAGFIGRNQRRPFHVRGDYDETVTVIGIAVQAAVADGAVALGGAGRQVRTVAAAKRAGEGVPRTGDVVEGADIDWIPRAVAVGTEQGSLRQPGGCDGYSYGYQQ